MSLKRMIFRNAVWNWAGVAVPIVAGFVVAPFLVHRLGEHRYGLWILIASMTSYFGLLDLGVRGSVGRYIAYYRARDEQDGVNAVLSTAAAILGGAACFTTLGTLVLLTFFFRIFEVPEDQVEAVRIALLIVGLNLAFTLPLNLFDATLWAFQRFDILNALDIPAVVVRTVLTFYFIGNGYGLVALAWITFLTTVGTSALKAALSFYLDPRLRLSPRLVQGAAFRTLVSYGTWLFVLSVTRLAIGQVNPIVIGARLGVQWVTPYSIVVRLVTYIISLLIACTGVLTPVATTMHAQGSHREQRQMFLEGGKYCLLFALFFLTAYVILGRAFLRLWMGPDLEYTATLLSILILGETLPMSQWVTNSMILATGRHRPLATASIIECAAAITLTVILSPSFGLVGACIALAVPATLCRGLFQMIYGCRVAQVPLTEYCRSALIPPLASAVLPALVLMVSTAWHYPHSWLTLIAQGAIFFLVYGLSWVLLFERERLKITCFDWGRKVATPVET